MKRNSIIYEKFNEDKSIFFVVNNSDVQITIPVIEALIEKEIFEYTFETSSEKLHGIDTFKADSKIEIKPYGFRIFEVKNY